MPNRLFIGGSEHGGWADCEDKDLVCVPRPYDPDAPQSVTGDQPRLASGRGRARMCWIRCR
jgi:hypothetical protein